MIKVFDLIVPLTVEILSGDKTSKVWICPKCKAENLIENTDIFDGADDENETAIDNLFDDDEKKDTMVEVVMLKNTTLNGTKLVKETVLSVTEDLSLIHI